MTDKTPDGNLLGFLNTGKKEGDRRPLFQGKMTLSGSSDARGFALWPHKGEHSGESVLSGKLAPSAMNQIEQHTDPAKLAARNHTITLPSRDGAEGLVLEPGAILMFKNKTKDLDNPSRPDWYGYCNPGDGERLQKIGAWARTDRRGNAMLSGSLQVHEPGLEREAMEMKEPDHQAIERGMEPTPPKVKRRSREPEYDQEHEHAR